MAEPQVNANALGAPAEGFGQTVTFAFDPTGSAPQVRPVQRRAPTVGIQGNLSQASLANPNAAQAAAAQVTPDPTAALLMKVGKDILQKKVDEARSAEYVKGMQASMNGQALEEIKSETPWYAKIFGDTPMIEGARAYEAQDVVNKTLGQATRDMESLKKLTPDQAAQHFSGMIKAVTNTGDSARDAIVTKAMLDQMPALMKAQSKANFEYGQQKARKSMGQSILSGGAALQELGELYAGDKISEADMNARSQQYLMSVIPPEGINEENYGKTLTSTIQQMAAQGQFHAVEAIRKSGALAALSPEQSKQVEANILMNANRNKDRYASMFVRDMASLQADAQFLPNGMTPADIQKRAQDMNKAYQKLTGSPVGLYTSDEVVNLGKSAILDIQRQAQKAADREQVLSDRNATDAQKTAAAEEKQANIRTLVSTGQIDVIKTRTKASDDDIDSAFLDVISNPKADGSFIINQAFIKSGYVNKVLANQYQSGLREAEGQNAPTDNWFREVNRFNQMVASTGGYAFAQAYYGDYAPKLMRAARMSQGVPIEGNPQADRIFQSSMSRDAWDKPQPIDKKERVALLKAAQSKANGWLPRWLGGKVQARPAAMDTLMDIAESNVEDWRGAGLSDQEAIGVGVQAALSSGKVEMLGGFAIRNTTYQPGGRAVPTLRSLMSGDPKGSTYIAIPEGAQDDYFEGFLFDALKVPKDIGSHMLSRVADAGGTQRFVFTAQDKDGVTRMFNFSAQDLQTYAGARSHKDTKPREQGPLAFGPKITYTADVPTEKNMYITAEERARRVAAERRKTQPK